jgi:peptide/nickel transport system ATP-binding protein
VKALEGVDLTVRKGEILGLVGESGCGKTVTALSIAGLLPANAEVVSGEVWLNGTDLMKAGKNEMRQARLNQIALIFQDTMTYLNPVISIGDQITETLAGDPKAFKDELIDQRLKELEELLRLSGQNPEYLQEREKLLALKNSRKLSKKEAKRLAKYRAIDYLRLVRLPEPERIFKMYPFELSGGMRQRAMIAMALVRRPKVLLADEITTALDVTVQAQILELLKELRDKIDAGIILITHDLAVVSEVCDRVAVMYAGNVVELAEVNELFNIPLHPYTQGLMAAIPRPDRSVIKLDPVRGSVPDLIFPPSGCRFHPRCPKAFERCPTVKPPPIEVRPGHQVECLLYGG